MVTFNQPMKHGVGDKSVSFVGREPFQVKDKVFKAALLGHGVFEEVEGGALRYSGDVTVMLKDGTTRKVDKDGELDVLKTQLMNDGEGAFT